MNAVTRLVLFWVSMVARVLADGCLRVIAMLEGSDPVLKKEAVIVSGHYDHNGATAEQIFNGADDNASGAAGMLEIAEAWSKLAEEADRQTSTTEQ